MNALDKMRAWIATYPGFEILSAFQVDYVDHADPGNGGISPSGLVEIDRKQDILGNVTVYNQYNFGLYYVFGKPLGDDAGASVNADWVMGFQEWVQEQSVRGLAPSFGDEPRTERVSAQNGGLFDASEEGVATYMVQVSVQYKRIFERR